MNFEMNILMADHMERTSLANRVGSVNRADMFCEIVWQNSLAYNRGEAHKDHIKQDGAWRPRIRVKLYSAILSKLGEQLTLLQAFFRLFEDLEVEHLEFRGLYRVCFCWLNGQNPLLWLLVGYHIYYYFDCFIFFLKKQKQETK